MSTVTTSEPRVVTNADVFRRAADLLEEFGWCQGATCLYNESNEVVAYCMGGAIQQAIFDLGLSIDPVPRFLLNFNYVSFNDHRGRTKEEVVARLRKFADEQH